MDGIDPAVWRCPCLQCSLQKMFLLSTMYTAGDHHLSPKLRVLQPMHHLKRRKGVKRDGETGAQTENES